jgi:hypothetical protein
MSKFEKLKYMFKGASWLFFATMLILAAFNYSVLIDKRHVTLAILDQGCNAVALTQAQIDFTQTQLESQKQ